MPYTRTQPELPWQGKTPRSRRNSYDAAVGAQSTRVWKSAQYLAWLRQVGRATDHGAADHFGWPLSSICSIRNGLVDRGLVTDIGEAMGKHKKRVTIWGPVK
jgi:hypothetical protein